MHTHAGGAGAPDLGGLSFRAGVRVWPSPGVRQGAAEEVVRDMNLPYLCNLP